MTKKQLAVIERKISNEQARKESIMDKHYGFPFYLEADADGFISEKILPPTPGVSVEKSTRMNEVFWRPWEMVEAFKNVKNKA